MRQRSVLCSRQTSGSIILETAIAVPVFLLLGAFLLTVISCARADILLSAAVDQVTQELSIAVPVAGAGIDFAGEALSYINSVSADQSKSVQTGSSDNKAEILFGAAGSAGAVLDIFGIKGEDILSTLLFGGAVKNRIIETYNSYYPSEKLLHSRIINVSVYLDFDVDLKVIWMNVYYQWNTLFGTTDKMIISAVPVYGDLELTLPETKDDDQEDKVWLLSNFARGLSLRNTYGGNLPVYYPVIAKWDNGTATSIKSIDLTAPGYQNAGTISETVQEYINDLAGFEGTLSSFGNTGIQISSDQISNRVLIIIIPKNSPEEVYNELNSGTAYASMHGVQIKIEQYGSSFRFVDKQTNEVTAADDSK
jgi:hypothetical protein